MKEKKLIRKFIIDTLNDDYGISETAYSSLADLCKEYGWTDILDAVNGTDGRSYIDSETAEELLKVQA